MSELQVIEQNAIVAAFQSQGGTDALFERIAEQARSVVPDVTTKKGRDAIGSLAAKVSSSKKLAEKYALDLVADQKAQIKIVDQDRIQFCKKMDALRDEILAPRDAYEQAEKDRVAKHKNFIASIFTMGAFEQYENRGSDYIKQMFSNIEDIVIDSSLEEFEQEAKIAKFETLEKLRTALAAREKYEAEQAELERLRQAELERQQRERDEAIARQAAENARIEAENKAQAEREQAEKLAREFAEREARLKAEKEAAELREAQLKQQAIEQAKQAEIQKQQAIEAERLRIEAEQAAKIKADQEAEAVRLANKEHMRSINREILNKLCEIGLDEGQAKAVITAIANNQVPHVSVKY
ncbi:MULTISPECIES: hypothetical protein [Acinetobacter]|uniref:Uncharacterized protein n=2 Tax=Acinetobacter TaxID=469 RepID=N9DGJ7_9GAMM|nr:MULTISPECIES: hypothetical protein [Acinetobacter]ENV79593.1 hypothetical protein F942_01783 [Acinetobacter ursingii ANC 3649]